MGLTLQAVPSAREAARRSRSTSPSGATLEASWSATAVTSCTPSANHGTTRSPWVGFHPAYEYAFDRPVYPPVTRAHHHHRFWGAIVSSRRRRWHDTAERAPYVLAPPTRVAMRRLGPQDRGSAGDSDHHRDEESPGTPVLRRRLSLAPRHFGVILKLRSLIGRA